MGEVTLGQALSELVALAPLVAGGHISGRVVVERDAARLMEARAARAGVTKGTVYLYFKTKEDLFKELVRSRRNHALRRAHANRQAERKRDARRQARAVV